MPLAPSFKAFGHLAGRPEAADGPAVAHGLLAELEHRFQAVVTLGVDSTEFADPENPARSAMQAGHVHHHPHRRGDVGTDRLDRQVDPGHQDHHLEAHEGLARVVRVDRREGTLVAGVHRLEQVERLGAPGLAEQDAVGSHAEAVSHKLARRDLALAVGAGLAGFQPHHMRVFKPEFRRVLDGDDAFAMGNRRRKRVQQGCFPAPVPPEIRMLSLPLTQAERNSSASFGRVPLARSPSPFSRLPNRRTDRTGPCRLRGEARHARAIHPAGGRPPWGSPRRRAGRWAPGSSGWSRADGHRHGM